MTDILSEDSGEYFSQSLAIINEDFIDDEMYVLGNPELPIAMRRADIEASVIENNVTIVQVPTGGGKSTQVAQYVRELGHNGTPLFDEIILTQPRIIAARTVSERIADEISRTNQSHAVGYYTSKEGSEEPQRDQHIAVLTDGKAAAQLIHRMDNGRLDSKRLLIIDEVHEWNLHIELLVAIATKKTDPRSPQYDKNLKVVIMSATMDAERILKHFANTKAQLIEVDVPTHEVTRSVSSKSVAEVALQYAADSTGKVLAFHAGKGEIKATTQAIERRQERLALKDKVTVVPLHGQLTADEQRLAFEDYPVGAVVATTNAAETSLTVPGAVAVVDSGEVRVDRVRYDLIPTGSEGLYLEDAPKANLNQRAGRVGRTGPGHYTLCSQKGGMQPLPFDARPEYATPSIQRSYLDGMLLRLRACGYEGKDFRFFHEPPKEALEAAKKRLIVLGALDEMGKITKRGQNMERLPLDPEYSCMVVFAYEKGFNSDVKRHVLDIASIMQRGGILKRAPKEQRWRELLEVDSSGETAEKDSDFFAQLEAYVEIMYHMQKEDWKDYDIIEHSADLVEQGRASLARTLGENLQPVTKIAPSNRSDVLTCIHAGQLNQLYRRNGERWSLVQGSMLDFELSESSVVLNIGQLVTGSLFSLGIRGIETIDAIQNVNRISSMYNLEQAAGHLVKKVYSTNNATYDHEKNALVIQVDHKLGPLVLRTTTEKVDIIEGSEEVERLREGHKEHAWNVWPERKALRSEYTSQTIDEAIKNPESAQYGSDPITGEPLLAWRGGKGQWCRSEAIALASLVAFKTQLNKRPLKDDLRFVKEEVKAVRGRLIALKTGRGTGRTSNITNLIIKELLARKSNTREWLDEANQLLSAE